MEPVSNAETKFMNNFARMYEIERIERVLDSLDKKVFKDLSAYADAEHFLRFARDEIHRLQAENKSIQQERDKLIEERDYFRDNRSELFWQTKQQVNTLTDLLISVRNYAKERESSSMYLETIAFEIDEALQSIKESPREEQGK